MKKIIVALAMLAASASAVSAHAPREAAEQELHENCVACCLATRNSIKEAMQINERACWEACGGFIRALVETTR
ncbi:MAG: hypothetical protein OXH50_15470 [Gemmatimonadetes bacterium]|nr:hypothetical protein [Gemmatimonadota bacterium]